MPPTHMITNEQYHAALNAVQELLVERAELLRIIALYEQADDVIQHAGAAHVVPVEPEGEAVPS